MRIYLIAALCLILGTSNGFSQVSITQLPNAATPLNGMEVLPGVQNGQTVQIPETALGMQGPSSATDSHVAEFNGSSGRIIKDGGALGPYGQAVLGQLPGTTTNDSASAGNVGQYISSTVLSASAVSVTTGTPADVTSISLTAGDWNVWGSIVTKPAAGTTTTEVDGWINTTTASFPTDPNNGATAGIQAAFNTTAVVRLPVGMTRLSLSTTTTVYLSTQIAFGTSTEAVYGFIGARRMR